MVEKESTKKLKMLRSSKDSEFTSSEFETYYKSHGIKGRNSLHIHPNKMESWRRRMASYEEWASIC